jgi:hypothetical protein
MAEGGIVAAVGRKRADGKSKKRPSWLVNVVSIGNKGVFLAMAAYGEVVP